MTESPDQKMRRELRERVKEFLRIYEPNRNMGYEMAIDLVKDLAKLLD